MREIKFRGKDRNNNWQIGYLDYDAEHSCVHTINDFYIDNTETIGQYTGLNDKNGKEIYEGDKITYTQEVTEYEGSSKPYSYLDLFEGIVVYNSGCFWINDRPLYELLEFENEINIEVIGNIYDNAELLEKEGIKDENN